MHHQSTAIYVENAVKSYGSKSVLQNLSLSVPKGCIYGLLGSSGCGKTTILSSIVGRRKLDSGRIWVLGQETTKKDVEVNPVSIGYMPQEIALIDEFTVKECLIYFGRLLLIPDSVIEKKYSDLAELLDLPPPNRIVGNCSGGQQRRVSFAVALIHEPQLLILDEPTVGLDPILRDRIWHYLVQISAENGTSIIITTHYIEEARQCHKIGFLREGQILTEDAPNNLLNSFETNSLEDVFLVLSKRQTEGTLNNSNNQSNSLQRQSDYVSSIESLRQSHDTISSLSNLTKNDHISKRPLVTKRRLKALMDKNLKQIYRNKAGIAFILLFPIVELLAFLLAVGGSMKDISIAVVNEETAFFDCGNMNENRTSLRYEPNSCHFNQLSCRFLSHLNDRMLNLKAANNLPDALDGVRHGAYSGVIYIAANFTDSFEKRISLEYNDNDLNNSQIQVYLDMSNQQIGPSIRKKLFDLYYDFQKEIFEECLFEPKLADTHMNFHDPVYGETTDTYATFMLPSVLITMSFFTSCLATSHIIIGERSTGIWERSGVAGVTSWEITITHMLFQCIINSFQTLELLVITFWFFQYRCIGELWIVYILVALSGVCGLCCGFLISIVTVSHTLCYMILNGIFYMMINLCGLLWPLEAAPVGIRWIGKLMPFTIPCFSVRNVMEKGWGLSSLEVLDGFGVEIVWIALFMSASMFQLKNTL